MFWGLLELLVLFLAAEGFPYQHLRPHDITIQKVGETNMAHFRWPDLLVLNPIFSDYRTAPVTSTTHSPTSSICQVGHTAEDEFLSLPPRADVRGGLTAGTTETFEPSAGDGSPRPPTSRDVHATQLI